MDRGRRGRRLRPRSKVWEHFTRHTGDDGKERSKCNRCGKEYACCGGSTSNMLAHLSECGGDQGHVGVTEQQHQLPLVLPLPVAPADEEMQQQVPPLPLGPGLEEQAHHHGPGLDEEDDARRDLVKMIALHGYHPSVVEDVHFISFVRRLNPKFKLPVREDIEKTSDIVCNDINMPYDPWSQIAPGAGSFAVGKTRSVEAGEAVYIICNFIDDDWKLQRLVDHAYLVLPPGDHYNASASSLLGVPVVSAEVAAERVVSYVLAHEYYPLMVAGEMTGGLGHLELKRLVDQKMRSIGMEVFCTTNMDHILQSIARSLLPDSDVAEDLFSSVLDLQWARQDRRRLLSEHGLEDPLESSERWYWCYTSLVMADHELLLTMDSQTMLCNLWGEIHSSIKRVSASNTPTSNLCLEEILKVRSVVHSQLSATGAAHLPLTKALDIADKAIDDSYQLWSVPLVLDPRFKLRHIEEQFQKVFDDLKATNYTSQVRSMVKELYASYNDDSDDSDEELMFADSTDLQDNSHVAAKTELDEYLEDSLAHTTVGMDFDILSWWKVYGSVQYPTVARVARAALAMPTCSKLTSAQTANVKNIIHGYAKF